jgi:RNA 3'-terminal phosphate cyclase (ATP)
MVDIDGSIGEGGGQILRSSLALSLATGRPFRIRNVRSNRDKPGLLRQHLTAVTAAAEVGAAEVMGAAMGSAEITFVPNAVRPGMYHFSVGTAGSTTLVLQTVLPALALAGGRSEIVLEGGTHNPFAPPFDFLDKALLPLVLRMGPRVVARLERPGFYPAGGGRIHVTVDPTERLAPIELLDRGEITSRRAVARVSNLSPRIAERELAVVRERLGWSADVLHAEEVRDAIGPGNVIELEISSVAVTEVFTGFGRREASAEEVARGVVDEVREYLASDAPVGKHLADQLLVFLGLAGGGQFRTTSPTRHTTTNAEVVRAFLGVDVSIEHDDSRSWRIGVGPRAGGARGEER